MADRSAFADKFLKKLRRIDAEQIETYVEQLLREKALTESIVEEIEEGVLLIDPSGKIAATNRATAQILGLKRSELIGRTVRTTLRPEVLADAYEEFLETLVPVHGREFHFTVPRRRTIALSLLPIELQEGVRAHTLLLLADRTEAERRAEERQQIGNIESLAALTAGVAHEVKNPLNSLNIHGQLLRRAVDEINHPAAERLHHSVTVMLEEIQRLARVVDDFTRAVRPLRPRLQRADINRVLQGIAELIGPDCSSRQIELVLKLDPDIPEFPFDQDQIQQALLNVLKNAMEAIDKPDGSIHVRSYMKSDHVLLEVQDNGCGIPENERLKVFEPYHTTKFEGTGLGLMVVYRIVRAHLGAVGLRSEVGTGTVFSVALPLDERPIRLLAGAVHPNELPGLPP
jgi:PAS domain S-box-containing protein